MFVLKGRKVKIGVYDVYVKGVESDEEAVGVAFERFPQFAGLPVSEIVQCRIPVEADRIVYPVDKSPVPHTPAKAGL